MSETRTTPSIGWPVYARMMVDASDREDISTGIAAAVHQYYWNYTDETSVRNDYKFFSALQEMAEYADEDLDDIILRVEKEMHADEGRNFDYVEVED